MLILLDTDSAWPAWISKVIKPIPPPHIISDVVTYLSWWKDSKKDICWQDPESINRSLSAESLGMEGVVQTGSCRLPWTFVYWHSPGKLLLHQEFQEGCHLGVWARRVTVNKYSVYSWRNQSAGKIPEGLPRATECYLSTGWKTGRLLLLSDPPLSARPPWAPALPWRPAQAHESWVQIQLWYHLSCEFKILTCFSKLFFIIQRELNEMILLESINSNLPHISDNNQNGH